MKKRIKWSKIFTGAVVLVLLLSLLFVGCSTKTSSKQEYSTEEIFAMDTYLTWQILGDEEGIIGEALKEEIQHLEQLLSSTDEKGEIWALNQSAGTTFVASTELRELLQRCINYYTETEGAFHIGLYNLLFAWGFLGEEICVPDVETIRSLLDNIDLFNIQIEGENITLPEGMALDLGAVGKGYALASCLAILEEYQVSSALLSFGGDVYALGEKQDGSQWRIGIQLPTDSSELAGILTISNEAVLTSGTYERYVEIDGVRYHHILDATTGAPADNELDSVTIICADAEKADVLTTAYFVMGLEKSQQAWRNQDEVEVIWITKDGIIYYTEGLEGRFTVSDGLEYQIITRE